MKRGLKTFLIAGVFSMMTASIFAQAPAFDLKKGTLKLNSGHEMPILGIGTYQAQIIIRWHLQAGNIAIPGSSNEKHIIEDACVWDFSLTDDEMRQMAAINKDRRNANY